MKRPTEWEKEYYGKLKGKTIRSIPWGTSDGDIYPGLLFTDGTVAWIERDAEGNGPGFLRIQDGR